MFNESEYSRVLFAKYKSCGGNCSLEELKESIIQSVKDNPELWKDKDLTYGLENLIKSLIYIWCTDYHEIIKLAEEKEIDIDKYVSLSPEVKETINALRNKTKSME